MRTAVQLGFNGYGVLGRLPETDLSGALQIIDDAGFDGVEVMSNVAGQKDAVALFSRRRTRVAALHLFLDDLRSPQATRRWIGTMTEMDCGILALSAFGMDQSIEGYRALAVELRAIGENLIPWGKLLYFHCHAAELSVVDSAGQRGVDVMTEILPDLRIVIDTHWVSVAGLDPALFIRENTGRSGYYHLKDGDGSDGTEFGKGSIPMRSCIAAAVAESIDWLVLEQDRPASDVPGVFERFQRLVDVVRKGN